MDTMLIYDDDERCRQVERLIAELSSELCATELDDLDSLIETMLSRIGDAAGADSTTLIVDGPGSGESRSYRWAGPAMPAQPDADDAGISPLWDQLQLNGEPLVLHRIPADVPSAALTAEVVDYLRRAPLQSAVVLPVMIANERICVVVFEGRTERTWSSPLIGWLRLFAEILGGGVHRHQQSLALQEAHRELARVTAHDTREMTPHDPRDMTPHDTRDMTPHDPRDMTPREGRGSGDAIRTPARFSQIVGDSASLQAALRQVQRVAGTSCTVLLRGETGTGKELFARAIHAGGSRRSNAFIGVNCAALPGSLIESELFGHTRGAFTGAVTTRQGRFELAHRGTLFLDEIGDLPLDLQTKLLRVLQEGTFERIGSSQTQKVDARIIAATHRDLRRMIKEGTFREDLYYRLNVFPIRVPPLRERPEDLEDLIWYIIRKQQPLTNHRITRVPPGVVEQLRRRQWPGNVRELENVIERALIHSTGEVLTLRLDEVEEDVLDTEVAGPEPDGTTLSSVERMHIQEVLRACGWRINGTGNAAERLGLHPNTLRFRMKKLGIVREDAPRASVHVAAT